MSKRSTLSKCRLEDTPPPKSSPGTSRKRAIVEKSYDYPRFKNCNIQDTEKKHRTSGVGWAFHSVDAGQRVCCFFAQIRQATVAIEHLFNLSRDRGAQPQWKSHLQNRTKLMTYAKQIQTNMLFASCPEPMPDRNALDRNISNTCRPTMSLLGLV